MKSYIEKLIKRMEIELSCSAHNIDHVMRVYNTCKLIASSENDVDMRILEPAALLHDIARVIESNNKSGNINHASLGADMAEEVLNEIEYPKEFIEPIRHCIETHRFRTDNAPKTIEAKILFDADKLDVIGSIGIARTFMLAGQFGQRITTNISKSYINNNTVKNGRIKDVSKHSPLMEYEYKFKKIPERLYTEKGKQIGKERLSYMKDYFNRLKLEVNGKL